MNWTLFVDRMVEQPWIENGADAAAAGVRRFYGAIGSASAPVRNFLHGIWLGHPFHPVVTDIVVGAASTLAVLDVAEAAGAKQIAPAADLALVTGISSAVVAAAAGVTDWHVIDGTAKKVGFVHMLFNLTGTSLYVASLVARKLGNRSLGRALAFTAYGTLFGGAYLGGHLVFAKKIGVDHAAGWEEKDEYATVMGESELGQGEIKRVMLDETPLALLRNGATIVAMSDSCAHLGCSLAEMGVIEGDSIRCSCHGSRYRLADGAVLEGPSAHPQPVYDAGARRTDRSAATEGIRRRARVSGPRLLISAQSQGNNEGAGMKLKPIDEQVVVLFGASSGIGREAAMQFAERGAKVVVAARREDALESLAQDIRMRGGVCVPIAAEAADFAQVKRVADDAAQRFGRIDTWVQLASVSVYAPFEQTEPDEFKRIIDVNLVGAAYGAHAALPYLKESGGALIMITSVEAVQAIPFHSAYAASKHGLRAMTEVIRMELEAEGAAVSVTNIMPVLDQHAVLRRGQDEARRQAPRRAARV